MPLFLNVFKRPHNHFNLLLVFVFYTEDQLTWWWNFLIEIQKPVKNMCIIKNFLKNLGTHLPCQLKKGSIFTTMPHRTQNVTNKIKEIEVSLNAYKPFMGEKYDALPIFHEVLPACGAASCIRLGLPKF